MLNRKEHLSSLLATMNLLAFALHTFLEQATDRLRRAPGACHED